MIASPQHGVQSWPAQHNITVLRLHYEADEEKGCGEKIFIPEINRWLSPWAHKEYLQMTNPAMFLQEFEIDAEATLGSLLYQMDEEATIEEEPFNPPPEWTRRMSLDPHPGVPHAFLWCATDPWGDRWYYRELWPSKVCFRYDGAMLLGKAGPCPPDDNRVRISEYVETVKWLESKENALENTTKDGKPFDELIHQRVIDYAARAFGKGTNDDPEEENFQQRYEKYLQLAPKATRPYFDDAKKDHDAGQERVAEGLKPREVMANSGEFRKRSRIHIMRKRCPELIWQLKNNRRQQLTPTQVEKQDPSGTVVKVRNHQTDNLRYIEMSNPVFVPRSTRTSNYRPPVGGLSY